MAGLATIALAVVVCMRAGARGSVLAQTTDFAFRSDASYTFGQKLHFQLTATTSEDVEEVMLFFKAPEFPNTFRVRVLFTAEETIEADYSVDLADVRLSPFTTVTYWWILSTESGEELSVPQRQLSYEDNQFDWREARQEGIRIYWTGEESGLGQLTLDIIAEAIPQLETVLPGQSSSALRFYIYPSSADLRAALRLTGRDWVGGHADPELGVILLVSVNAKTAATDLRRSIPHELTHFRLYQATGANYDTLPLWFSEGLATTMEAAPYAGYEVLLKSALDSDTTIPFSELCYQFPPAEERALLAYAQSASLVDFIKTRYGDHVLRELVEAFADGADCQAGVQRTLQMSLDDLNQAWLGKQEPRPALVSFLVDNSLWLLLLAGGFGLSRLLFVNPSAR
jgi:hypothetical protein